MTKVLLYSGGMDSVAMDLLWQPDVRVYVDMGTAYTPAERSRVPADVEVVHLPLAQWERPDGIIPLRNLMLVCVAAQYGDIVGMAATAGDKVLDKSVQFAEMTSGLLSFLWSPQSWTPGEPRTVVLPLKGMTKREIVRKVAEDYGADGVAALAGSWSCYGAGPDECGVCKPCTRKWVAFAANGWGHMVPDGRPAVVRDLLPLIAAGTLGRRRESEDVLAALGVVAPENEMQAAQVLLEREA